MKELAPSGSQFFPYRVDPCLEGDKNKFDGVVSPKRVSIPLKAVSIHSKFSRQFRTSWYFC